MMRMHTSEPSAVSANRNARDAEQGGGRRDAPGMALADRRPATASLQDLQQLADRSPRAVQLRQAAERASGQVAASAATGPVNQTGLPDQLKAGIESLSGMRMDHVKVHYRSSRPAQMGAHAYAQGGDIHIAPGQEAFLPHEAWHVVQQAQGRVRPTMQLKGNVAVNDDAALEHEADVMGARANAGTGLLPVFGIAQTASSGAAAPLQRVGVDSEDLAEELFQGGEKVALVGENHKETDAEAEGAYFRSFDYGYHTEISAYWVSYQEAGADNTLIAKKKVDDFSVESMPLRALADVLDLPDELLTFMDEVVRPLSHFWADVSRANEKIERLNNPRMIDRETAKRDEARVLFQNNSVAGVRSGTASLSGTLGTLVPEMRSMAAGLEGTAFAGKAAYYAGYLDDAMQHYEALLDFLDEEIFTNLDVGEMDRWFAIVRGLEEFDAIIRPYLSELAHWLRLVIAKEGLPPLADGNIANENEVNIARSGAMLKNAQWLAENSGNRGEVVKVGDSHINDIKDEAPHPGLVVVPKDAYYAMQDRAETTLRH